MLQLEPSWPASAHPTPRFGVLEGFLFVVCLSPAFACLCFWLSLALLKSCASCSDFFKRRASTRPRSHHLPQTPKTTRERWNASWASAPEDAFSSLHQWTPCCTITPFITKVIICSSFAKLLHAPRAHFSPKPPTETCRTHGNTVSISIWSIYECVFSVLNWFLIFHKWYIIVTNQGNQSDTCSFNPVVQILIIHSV